MIEGEMHRYSFKVLVIGDSQVGKTTLMKKFTEGTFEKSYLKTVGAQFSKFKRKIEGISIKLLFWCIAAEEEFHFLYPSFFREKIAAIIIFSLENNDLGRESFNHISFWHEQVQKHCGDVPIYLFGNKVDLIDEDEFDESQIEKIVKEFNLKGYYLTSTVTGLNIVKAFNDITIELYNRYKAIPPAEPKISSITNEKKKKKKRRKKGT
jgi:small GTP-binding protein